MTQEELQEKFEYFRERFNIQRNAKYEYEYRTGCWRFYYTLVKEEKKPKEKKHVQIYKNTHVEVEKLNDSDKEFKQLFRWFKRNLKKNEGIEWYNNSLITKQMFNKYKISKL